MTKLDSYIRNTVLIAIVMVLLVLAGLDLIFTLFDEIGESDEFYSSSDAVLYVFLTLPRHIYELLPMSSLIGALVGLGILASSNELVVMQAAGIKVSRIVWSVMKPTALIMVVGLMLGEYIAPTLELKAEVNKSLKSGEDMILSRDGYWLKEGRQYLHANAIEPGGVLHNITMHEYDERRQPMLYTIAERAEYFPDEGENGVWRLENVSLVRLATIEGELLSLNSTQDVLEVDLNLDPELLNVLVLDADKMAISDLYQYARYFDEQGQDASQYFLSFWKKLLQPLTTGVLVLVAISFIFGPLRSATMGSRLFAAICFGVFFIIIQRLLNTVSLVYQIDPLVAVMVPILLSAGTGFMLLRRAA